MADGTVRSLPRYFHQGSEYEWAGRSESVAVRSDLRDEEFIEEYVRRKRPVVIRPGVPREAVTPAILRAVCGDLRLDSLVSGGGGGILVRGRESAVAAFRSLRTLGEYLARFEEGADLPYLTNLCIDANFPALRDQLAPPRYFQPNWRTRWPLSALGFEHPGRLAGELFLGPPGSSYGMLHYDRHGMFIGTCQYYGRKLWWLCPPEQSGFLYPNTKGYPHLSPVDPFKPDLDAWPLFAQVRPHVVTLEAGDILFVPGFWWHLTNAVTPNISSVVRFVNRHNLRAHLWDMRFYGLHEPRMAIHLLKRLLFIN